MKKQRTPYRPEQGAALERIERRRKDLKISSQDLCAAADISTRTYRRMLSSSRGFDRHVRALRFALRTIEAKRRDAALMFEGGAHD